MSVSQLSSQFQGKLLEIQQKIKQGNGIPSLVQDYFINELRKISQEFNDAQRSLQHEFDRLRNERNSLFNEADEASQQFNLAIANRDQAHIERDALQATILELRAKARKSSDKLNQAEKVWAQKCEDLERQLSFKEEQLKGKRALWMESNLASGARREAMETIRDPFISPVISQTSGFEKPKPVSVGDMGKMVSPPLKSTKAGSLNASTSFAPTTQMGPAPSGAPRGPRRRPNLPTGRAKPPLVIPTYLGLGTAKIYNTEAGDPPPSMAMVLHKDDDDPAPEYQEKFGMIYALIEGWVKMYACIPHPGNDQAIARSNDVLWAFMLNCTYPGQRQDAHTHVMTLLSDVRSRYWFVMRIATTYCSRDIMTINTFYGFSKEIDAELLDVKKKLQERGMLFCAP